MVTLANIPPKVVSLRPWGLHFGFIGLKCCSRWAESESKVPLRWKSFFDFASCTLAEFPLPPSVPSSPWVKKADNKRLPLPKKLMTTENSVQVELPKNFLQKGTRSSRLHIYLCMTLANRKSGQNRFSDSRDKLHHSITWLHIITWQFDVEVGDSGE